MVFGGIARLVNQPEVWHLLEQDRQRRAQFQTRQRCADAEMRASTERGVGLDCTLWVKSVRVLPSRRVPVGGGQKTGNFLARLEHVIANLNLFISPSLEHMQWCVIADHFLDRPIKTLRAEHIVR